MLGAMRKSLSRYFALLLMLSAGSALADGGDWKMGPFGPYWDDNEWPEFTPMYWMEEFMNRLDDDDDEIRDWMLSNQFPGQAYPGAGLPGATYPGAAGPGAYPYSGWNSPGMAPYGWQPYIWNNPWTSPYALPRSGVPGNNWIDPYPPAAPYSSQRRLPRLTPQEYARMPEAMQREYRREFDREYYSRSDGQPRQQRRPLPNLTPEEYSRMPRELQREYKRAFDREYTRYKARQNWEREARRRALIKRDRKKKR